MLETCRMLLWCEICEASLGYKVFCLISQMELSRPECTMLIFEPLAWKYMLADQGDHHARNKEMLHILMK